MAGTPPTRQRHLWPGSNSVTRNGNQIPANVRTCPVLPSRIVSSPQRTAVTDGPHRGHSDTRVNSAQTRAGGASIILATLMGMGADYLLPGDGGRIERWPGILSGNSPNGDRLLKMIIETRRLLLREFVIEDAAEVFRINSDPEVVRYAEGMTPSSVEETLGHLKAGPLADYARYGYGRWAVVDRGSDTLIGMCGPKFLVGLGEVEMGYRLARNRWGLGLATEAAAAALDHVRDELGLDHLIALIMEENAASIRVVEKLGMKYTGVVPFEGTDVLRYEIAFAS